MKYFAVIYSTTCLKNTAYNSCGDYVTRVSGIAAHNYAEAAEKFLSRFRKSIKHNPVDIILILPIDTLLTMLRLS